MRNWSVFSRILILTVGTTVAVAVAVVMLGEHVLASQARAAFENLAATAADRLGHRISRIEPDQGQHRLVRQLREFKDASGVAGVVLFAADRRQVAAVPAGIGEQPPLSVWPVVGRGPVSVDFNGVTAKAAFFPLTTFGNAFGGAWLAIERDVVLEPVHRFRRLAVIVGLLAIVASVLLTVLIAGTVTAPLTDLSDLAARITQGELELRHSERGPKELARLGRHVNRLAEQLEASQIDLSKASLQVDGEVRGRTRYLQQTTRAMIDLANRDPLTGLANRRRLELELDQQIELARQTNNPLAVIMMDLDNFKKYNDTAGHLAGDNLLRTVADALRARTRITDLVVRWGGDEFCILIPYTPPDRAVAAAESLLEAVIEAARGVPEAAGVVGASAGVACYPDDAEGGNELIAAADGALYKVKESGRGHARRLGGQ
jgi:diguanylate cyclase (GGDEF)-like protein